MTIRQHTIRAAARAMIVADEAQYVVTRMAKRMSADELHEARSLAKAWADRGGDEVLALTVEQIAEGVELG